MLLRARALGFLSPDIALVRVHPKAKSSRQHYSARRLRLIGTSLPVRKLLSAVFNACLWIILLALAIVGVARVGVESMERRGQPHLARLQR
ncbi:hypothetical protein Q2941_10320 [Bradyrhizobium sp. UFLA05-153]